MDQLDLEGEVRRSLSLFFSLFFQQFRIFPLDVGTLKKSHSIPDLTRFLERKTLHVCKRIHGIQEEVTSMNLLMPCGNETISPILQVRDGNAENSNALYISQLLSHGTGSSPSPQIPWSRPYPTLPSSILHIYI